MQNNRTEKALDYFTKGYNCAQAVFAPFADRLGLDEQTALQITTALGGGVFGQRDICGAVSGLALALGLLAGGDGKLAGRDAAKLEYLPLLEAFEERFGAHTCRDLIEADIPAENIAPAAQAYLERNPRCISYVLYATELLQDYVDKHSDTL